MMACKIELEICATSSPDEFTTRVISAPSGGEPSAVARLDVDGLLRDRDTLETTVLASAVTGRKTVSSDEEQLRQMGRLLFDALFSGPVLGTYRASLGVAQQRGEPLRVVLRLTAPRLAALPWEALYDPETGTYICRREPLVRHVPAPYPEPLKVAPPLRVLGLVASPRGMPALDVSAEQDHLSQALATPIAEGLIQIEWLAQATWEAVQEKLLSGRWHVLHFVGHGDYDPGNDQGVIALVGEGGRVNLVGAEQLADLLNEARPTPPLVVLNSCSSGQEGTQDLFSGTAAALVHSGISAVAAMQFTVSDPAAIAFARGFYTAIAHGRGVDDATRSGRISILGAPGTLEWVTPVLYVRGENTQLFHLIERPPGSTASPVLPEKTTPASRPDNTSPDPQRSTAHTGAEDEDSGGSSVSATGHPTADQDVETDQTTPASSEQQGQIPQQEQSSHDALRIRKSRLLIPILAVTGVLAVVGVVLLTKFLVGSSSTHPLPPLVRGPDDSNLHESCDEGYSQPGVTGWASHAGRGTEGTSCYFAQSVLNAYWAAGPPSHDPRTISARGSVDCNPDLASCDPTTKANFLLQCAGDGSNPWIKCTGGENAVVYLW